MSMIHFVGGEKGGVGKSVVARLISQYCLDKGLYYSGLDADQSHGTTARYYKEFTQSLKLDEFESTDMIMELALEREQQVVVDMPAQSQRFLDRWIDENDVLDLCEEMNIPLVYWYVVDDSLDSSELLQAFLDKYKYFINCVVVKNLGRGSVFTEVDKILDGSSDGEMTRIQVLELPALHASTMFKINKSKQSFWSATTNTLPENAVLTLMERQRTKVWMKKAYAEIERILAGANARNQGL